MNNLSQYILEKLKINKDTLLKDIVPSEDDFFDILKKSGEVELKDVFGDDPLPYDEKKRDILSIYYDGDTPMYSYYNKSMKIDCESELYLDIFEDKEIIRIYNYMLANYNENA